jgi:hypothetical protein
MSLACDVKEIINCQAEIKATLAMIIEQIGDQATLTELCEKMEVLEEKICGPCPEEVVGEMTETSVTVAGETEVVAGDEIELFNDAGEVVGKAEVTEVAYDAETNQSTLTLANTETTAELSTVTTVKKKFVAATKINRESGKKKEG